MPANKDQGLDQEAADRLAEQQAANQKADEFSAEQNAELKREIEGGRIE
ncbi:MAG: hypothetical protein JWN01_1145 [Patescibacteria group bacterium]|nr:hypothetical protein [Patescibacteria group bacterium]